MRIGIAAALGALLATLSTSCDRPAHPRPAQLVLVVVDTLRADHLGLYGYPRDTTPGLAERATDARVFERAFATSPWTAPSFGSMFTGQMPSRHGAVSQQLPDGRAVFGRLDSGVETIAEILAPAGYATAAFVNNAFLSGEIGFDRGFDTYDLEVGSNLQTRRADEMIDLALDWVDRQGDRPFLLVLHLFDPHMAYDPPEATRGRFTASVPSKLTLPVQDVNAIRSGEIKILPEDVRFAAAAYDEEIAFVDQQLSRFHDELRDRAFFGRGFLAVTADHGEELFDHGGFEHGHAMWQELLHVPLLVWGPGVRAGREAAPVSVADIAPTLLDCADVPVPPGLTGISLWGNLRDAAPLPERTLYAEQNLYGTELKVAMRWPHKLIVNIEEGGRWLFDLEANPREEVLPWTDRAAVADELLEQMTERVSADLEQREEAPPAELGAIALEHLRSLGYVR